MTETTSKSKIKPFALIPTFADIGAATVTRSVTSPFKRSKGGARTYRRDVLFAALREIVSGFSTEEGQYLSPPTDKVYKSVAKSKKWKEHSVDLEHGAKGHWLGHHDAKYVMVYFHGGGYISPATSGHLKYQFALQKYVRKQGIDFSVLSLSYVLAPQGVYPIQIKQALSALCYLIETEKRDPSTILVAGDSAGGNLAAALLLHLGHPHPLVPELRLTKPLCGGLLISPWISFDTSTPSLTTNAHSDYLTIPALNRASAAFVGPGNKHDKYSEPINAPVSWWKEVALKAAKDVMIWGGGGEVLIDGIRTFGANVIEGFTQADKDLLNEKVTKESVNKVGESEENAKTQPKDDTNEIVPKVEVTSEKNPVTETNATHATTQTDEIESRIQTNGNANGTKRVPGTNRAKLIVTPKEAHEEMIIDYVLLISKKGQGAKEIENWLTATLVNSTTTTAQ